jgi:CheY-like chemotaxis protein
VFSNLLSNACRYTPEGGRIDVGTRSDSHGVGVDITDTGVGIEPAFQERVFDLFEQGDKSLERGNTGLGIGLTLSRQLVLLHGGTIRVASDGIGRGSTFTVELPTAVSAPQNLAEVPAAANLQSLAGIHILVADDNVDFAESLQVALESAGIAVRTVNDGPAALAAARAREPDLAILDIGMPGLNGYDLARALRGDAATAAIVLFAVSGWGQASDKDLANQAGFDRHFVKPVTPEALLEAIAEAMASGRRPSTAGTRET